MTTAAEAFDACVEVAREVARAQRAYLESETDVAPRLMHKGAAMALEGMAQAITELKARRCQQ